MAYSDRSSDPITSFSDTLMLETNGQRVTTLRDLSSSIRFWRKERGFDVIIFGGTCGGEWFEVIAT